MRVLVSKTAWSSRMCALTWRRRLRVKAFNIPGGRCATQKRKNTDCGELPMHIATGAGGKNANESKQENASRYQRSSSTSTDNVVNTYKTQPDRSKKYESRANL